MKFSFALVGVSTLLFQILSISAVSAQTASPQTLGFSDWCKVKVFMSTDTQHTIDVLLEVAGTQDCEKAESKLKSLTSLSLFHKQINDISLLDSFTNLTTLDLTLNNIIDLKPLVSLINITTLTLDHNNIINVKPLGDLSKLTALS